VRARLSGDGAGSNELRIDEASFSGTPRVRPSDRRIAAVIAKEHQGTLEASGTVKFPSLEGVVQVRMEKFPLLQRADRWLIATGGANMVYTPERAQLNGAAVVDAGFIDVSRRDAPTLSDDVVVHRRTDAPRDAAASERSRFVFDFDVTADLGPAFVLRGGGLDARIAGELRVRHEGKGLVRATGTLNTRDGTYQGYGQNLAIRRGRVLFNGPIDNPGLDILALRTGLPVDVGLSVTRTAQNPLVRLYSDPAMPEFETLSWLVLGRQPEEGRGDNAALATAALGLLGGGGESMPTTLARRLGIDEFTVRSGTSASTTSLLPRQAVAGRLRSDGTNTLTSDIVTIGKRLTDDITLSYEQVVGGAGGIAQLAYRLSRRLSVVARAGTDNALELVYSFSFD
jgi:translocation and assembly module TamB